VSDVLKLESLYIPNEDEEQRLAELQMSFDQFHNEYFVVYVKNQFSINKKDQTHKELRLTMFIIKSE
jgi:hypothetical protein